ncbi:MAG: HAMP domain-containing histidine kinase [bacterium]|nr:HAMP domain-containing histidine kinase [bacterium]
MDRSSRPGKSVFSWRRLLRRNFRFALRQFRKTRRLTARSPGRDFPRAAYTEVHIVLRYIYLILPILYVPFAVYDVIAAFVGWSIDARMVYFDLALYCVLLSMGAMLGGSRANRVSFAALRLQCVLGVGLFSLGGTAATILLFEQAQDLSLFTGVLLAIAVLFRFPDFTKFGIYALNYAILYAFFWSEGVVNPVHVQNPMFVLCIIVLFDRLTYFSMSNSYFKNQRILQLNRLILEEDRNKSEMIGIAIHDLKSPVTGIMSVSTLLRESPDGFTPDERDEILGEVQESSRAILGHIEDLVDIARSGIGGITLNYETFDALELVYGTIQNFNYQASLKDIHVYTRFADGPARIHSDRRSVAGILENLISNAIKYTPPGGSVLLQSRYRRPASITLDVCDEGPGFTAEDRSRLFSRFSRLSARPTGGESSTGIGLFTVYKLAQALDGVEIDLANLNDEAAGTGTRFSVSIPLADSEQASTTESA